VPRVLVWDGGSAIGRWPGGRVELTAECQAFRATLAADFNASSFELAESLAR